MKVAGLRKQSMDVAIIDAVWNGVWQAMKIAGAADAFEVNIAPHNFYGHLVVPDAPTMRRAGEPNPLKRRSSRTCRGRRGACCTSDSRERYAKPANHFGVPLSVMMPPCNGNGIGIGSSTSLVWYLIQRFRS